MKTFFRRLSVPTGLRRKRVVVPALALVGALLLGGLWILGHSGTNSVWNQPSVPISDVLDRVDRGDIAGATIIGQRILLTDRAGRQSWTIEKEASMSSTEQYLRSHNVKVAVQSTDDVSFTSALPNLLGLLVLLALLLIMLRRSNLLGNPMGAMTKHLADARTGDGEQVTFDQVVGVDEAKHEMFVGVGAARVRDLFRHAKKNSPCIIFLDEIDALGRKRGGSQIRTNEEREQTLNQLLVEMDGFSTDSAVVVIAATNRPDVLDPALLRSGRFDRRVAIDAPDLNGRRAILSLYAAQKPLADNINLDIVARQTPGFTGADLANLLNEAAILAGRNKKQAIGKEELEEASLRVMAGPEKRSRMITPEEKAIIAFHEVGHALVMKSIAKSDPVHKVSVVSRGQALGVTIQLPLKDRYLTSKSELIARMAAAMGGRAAEEIIFGDVTTGAKQDIEYATGRRRQSVLLRADRGRRRCRGQVADRCRLPPGLRDLRGTTRHADPDCRAPAGGGDHRRRGARPAVARRDLGAVRHRRTARDCGVRHGASHRRGGSP